MLGEDVPSFGAMTSACRRRPMASTSGCISCTATPMALSISARSCGRAARTMNTSTSPTMPTPAEATTNGVAAVAGTFRSHFLPQLPRESGTKCDRNSSERRMPAGSATGWAHGTRPGGHTAGRKCDRDGTRPATGRGPATVRARDRGQRRGQVSRRHPRRDRCGCPRGRRSPPTRWFP